jgi:peptide/nickel transport system permease protein
VNRVAASPWLSFLARRAARLAIGAVVLVVASFLMIHMVGGDPVRASLGSDAEPRLVAQRRAELHLNESLPAQFGNYVDDLASFDLGKSIVTDLPVSETISERLPATARLAGLALLLVLGLGIPTGLLAGAWTSSGRRRKAEAGFAMATGVLTAIPEYLMGALLVAVFALKLGLFPAAGMAGFGSYVLPALALALAPAAFLARVVRLETVNVLAREYTTTARSKQLPTRVLYLRHVVPNVLTASLTIAGVVFGGLIGGSVIIESVFQWPGIGTEVVTAILDKDYPIVQACVLVLGLMVLVTTTLVDVILVLLNPRQATLRDS